MKQHNCIIFLIIVFLLELMSEYAREGLVRVISLARIYLFRRVVYWYLVWLLTT
jgi:hypothetical protein